MDCVQAQLETRNLSIKWIEVGNSVRNKGEHAYMRTRNQRAIAASHDSKLPANIQLLQLVKESRFQTNISPQVGLVTRWSQPRLQSAQSKSDCFRKFAFARDFEPSEASVIKLRVAHAAPQVHSLTSSVNRGKPVIEAVKFVEKSDFEQMSQNLHERRWIILLLYSNVYCYGHVLLLLLSST